jgi:HSP20 family protein
MIMNIIKRSGMPSLSTMFSDMFENDFFSNRFPSNLPAVNIKENGDDYKVEVAAPGLKKDDFKITVEDDIINISAEHEDEKKESDGEYSRREYNYNSFSRSFTLPEGVKEEDINAKYEDGILKLTIPKKEEIRKKIEKKEIKIS